MIGPGNDHVCQGGVYSSPNTERPMKRPMKRSISTAVIVMAVMASAAGAQENGGAYFANGSMYAGPRVWLGNLNGSMAIGGQVEKGMTKAEQLGPGIISGGVGVDYYSWSWNVGGGLGEWSYSVIPLQVFSNYHFPITSSPKLDPYLGLALVYSIVNASWDGAGAGTGAAASSLGFAGQGGLRYFLTRSFAIQGQVGFGYGTLGVGTSWRF
jgi:hypothetical protein